MRDDEPRPVWMSPLITHCQWNLCLCLCVECLFLRSPSRVPYRTELIPRAPKGLHTRTPHP